MSELAMDLNNESNESTVSEIARGLAWDVLYEHEAQVKALKSGIEFVEATSGAFVDV